MYSEQRLFASRGLILFSSPRAINDKCLFSYVAYRVPLDAVLDYLALPYYLLKIVELLCLDTVYTPGTDALVPSHFCAAPAFLGGLLQTHPTVCVPSLVPERLFDSLSHV
jgi:hypothetical protein